MRKTLFFALLLASLSLAAGAQDAAPLFAAPLKDLQGRTATLDNQRGKPLLVNFWARWCQPCRTELPALAAARQQIQQQGGEILGIAVEDQAEAVREFLAAYEVHYPNVLAGGDRGIPLLQSLGNPQAGLPYTLGISREGRVVYRRLGPMRPADLAAATTALRNADAPSPRQP